MALSNAEKVAAYKKRKREAEKLASVPKLTDYKTPFFEYLNDDPNLSDDFHLPLELAGFDWPDFSDDRGPSEAAIEHAWNGIDDPFPDKFGSIGRADAMIELLMDAARGLARIVNNYKRQELAARLVEIENSDLSDPAKRKAALADVVRLTKSLDQLSKQVRWTLPEWKVTGM